MADDAIVVAQQVLDSQPFSQMLGTRLTRWNAEGITLELDVRPDLLQQHGFVHGGVLCYLADNAVTFAAGQVLGTSVLTASVNLHYLRPAKGEVVIARATTQAKTSGRAVATVEIYAATGGKEYLCAAGSGTVSAIRSEESTSSR
ncbi:PaaI family thioesterase [Leucobacter sp. G161]|uniref:PaaI family thioesterase n=1 Tax=Leucobacter sp. G161 TaxID=663704 RepID=UPI00073AFDFE|nr:PaaI family thioesterase [Leucobacter sp. G161]KUF06631.1 hypothetical protein AUL38_11410 [Leucobacter sp. G161]